MADTDFRGGRCSVEINGRQVSTRAGVKHSGTGVSIDSGANDDGSMYSTVKAELVEFEMSFDRGDPVRWIWDDADLLRLINVTVTEEDARVQHFLTGARYKGKPQTDTTSGEVTGLSVTVARRGYQRVALT